jgi:hypothetical protein
MSPADFDLVDAINQAVERAVGPFARELKDFKEHWLEQDRRAADSRKEIHQQQAQQIADIAVLGERVMATRTKLDDVGLAVRTLQLDVARSLDKGDAAEKALDGLGPRVDELTTFKNQTRGGATMIRLTIGFIVGIAGTLAAWWAIINGSHQQTPPHP